MKKILAFFVIITVLLAVSCNNNEDEKDTKEEKEPTWNDKLSKKYGKPFGWDAQNGLGPLKAEMTNMSAEEYFHAKGLNAGWNLGNTYDLNSNPRALSTNANYDKLMAGIKAAGFNVIRIPSSWGLSTATPTISSSFLDDIEAAVQAAHAAGLVVFINTHHNKAFFDLNQAGDSFAQLEMGEGDGAVYQQITTRFIDTWATIAERFKDYGSWLIFESLNEPTITSGGSVQWDGAGIRYMLVLNNWNQAFVDTVRDTEGNNLKRYLIFKSYAGKLDTSLNFANEFKIPDDYMGPGRLIFSFHSYVPQPLGLEGQATDWDETHGNSYMTMFKRAHDNYVVLGIPVFMGETGATFHSQRSGEGPESGVNGTSATANRNRLLLLNALGYHARTYGVIPCLWDNGEATRAAGSNNPNGETFAMFRRKPEHDSNPNNYGLPIDHTRLAGGMFVNSSGGAAMNSGNTARGDPDFGKRTIEAFIDAVNGKKPLGEPRFDPE